MVCTIYALVRGLPSRAEMDQSCPANACRRRNAELGWTFACGALLGLTYATRGLTALVVPFYLFAVWFGARSLPASNRNQYILALVSGLGVALMVFAICWYLPNHSEISRVNRYYVVDLLVPHSLSG